MQTTPLYPAVLFFHQGTVAQGEAFFRRFWPEARAVSDAAQRFYRAFGLAHAQWHQIVGPAALLRGLQATVKGNCPGLPVGDPLMMPGAFLVQGDAILWQHPYRHVGDHPDFARIPTYLASAP